MTETKICGGGAKSPLWRKMIANILNIKGISSCHRGRSGTPVLQCLRQWEQVLIKCRRSSFAYCKIKETIEPDKEIAARYEKKYQQFKKFIRHSNQYLTNSINAYKILSDCIFKRKGGSL